MAAGPDLDKPVPRQLIGAVRLASKATITSGLRLGIFEVFRSCRHYLQAQSRKLLSTGRLEEGGVERGCSRRSLEGLEGAIVSQTHTVAVSIAMLGKLPRGGVERIWDFPCSQIPSQAEANELT